MSEYGITETGFSRKRLDVILAELTTEFENVFGANLNTAPESVEGQILGIISESYADLWELIQRAYDSYNPSAATGVQLSNLVQINNITRQPATFSQVELTLTGNDGTFIAAGSSVSTADGATTFNTVSAITISGATIVNAVAAVTGSVIAAVGTLDTIVTPLAGWDTVTNVAAATIGRDLESDPELRSRRIRSVALSSVSTVDSIVGAVAAIEGVIGVTVLDNPTNAPVDGLPAHNVHVIVEGGNNSAIGRAIFEKIPAGIPMFGTVSEFVSDNQGITHEIKWSAPALIPVFVTVNLTVDSNYPVTGDDDIKQAIVDYANGDLVTARGFNLGDDIIHSELYTPVNTVFGHTVDSLFIDVIGSPSATGDLPVNPDERGLFTTANIVVNS